jgi:hypothetical protein
VELVAAAIGKLGILPAALLVDAVVEIGVIELFDHAVLVEELDDLAQLDADHLEQGQGDALAELGVGELSEAHPHDLSLKLQELVRSGLLIMTILDKLTSRLQKYLLTDAGRQLLECFYTVLRKVSL